jgi:DinB superfamily
MHARLAETMTFVEEKRRELLQSFDGVEGDRLCRRAAPDGWSVAEILEHLRMVESGVARLITKRVGQAREAGLGEEKSTASVLPSFDRYSAILEKAVMKSPPTVVPRANIDISDALEGLESSREALRAAVVSATGLSLGEIKHTHQILGELDLYQWLIFVGHHEGRHKKQIERTLKSIPE